MKTKAILTAALAIFLGASLVHPAGPPSFNEKKFLENVRKSLSVAPDWSLALRDLRKSPFSDFYQGLVEFRSVKMTRSQNVFISKDSRHYIMGNLFDMDVDMDAERRKKVTIKGSPYKGNKNAPVTVIEYSDLQCGSCKSAHDSIRKDKVLESFKGKVRFVYKHFPLSKHHNWALQASIACACAYRQSQKAFWKMHNDIFYEQNLITKDNLRSKVVRSARESRIDVARFQRCYDTRKTLSSVQADINEGNSLGVGSTPSFLINGRLVRGYPGSKNFKRMIQEFLPAQ